MRLRLNWARRHWFIGLLFASVALGIFFPAPGRWLGDQFGTKPFIFILLLLSGLTFNASELAGGFASLRPLALSLLGTYLLLPLLFCASAGLLGWDSPIGTGLRVLGAVPTTLASGVIWTSLSGGNTALAVALTAVSNIVNVGLCPVVLKMTFGQALTRPFGEIVLSLALFVLLPIVLGQFVRRGAPAWIARRRRLIGVLARILICSVIVQAVSGAASNPAATAGLSAGRFLLLALACLLAHVLALAAMNSAARWLKIPRRDRIATVFLGSQKTLPVGVYVLQAFFPEKALGVISLVSYHAIQLIFDSFLIEKFKRGGASGGEP